MCLPDGQRAWDAESFGDERHPEVPDWEAHGAKVHRRNLWKRGDSFSITVSGRSSFIETEVEAVADMEAIMAPTA